MSKVSARDLVEKILSRLVKELESDVFRPYSESDVKCELYARLRQALSEQTKIAVNTEVRYHVWRARDKCDLVLWSPITRADRGFVNIEGRQVLVAIEIKYWDKYGLAKLRRRVKVDEEKLANMEDLNAGAARFLLIVSNNESSRVLGEEKGEQGVRRFVAILPERWDLEMMEMKVNQNEKDDLYEQAVRIVAEEQVCSISMVQRRLGIGFNRACRIVEIMEKEGVVTPIIGANPRKVLVSPQ